MSRATVNRDLLPDPEGYSESGRRWLQAAGLIDGERPRKRGPLKARRIGPPTPEEVARARAVAPVDVKHDWFNVQRRAAIEEEQRRALARFKREEETRKRLRADPKLQRELLDRILAGDEQVERTDSNELEAS
jgi:hypothetical protein